MDAFRGRPPVMIGILAPLFLMIPRALPAQAPTVTRVFNSGSADARLSPGALATVRGANLVVSTSTDDYFYPQTPGVTVGGKAAYVLPISNSDGNVVDVQLPVELAPGRTTLVVTTSAGTSAPFDLTLEAYAPGLLPGIGVARSGSEGCYARVAALGDLATVFATGLGATILAVATGTAAPSQPLASTIVKPVVTVGGRPAEVLESVLAPGPGRIGQYRVTFRIPQATGAFGVQLAIGGVNSNTIPLAVGSSYPSSNFLSVGAATWLPGPAAPESLMVAYSCYPAVLSAVRIEGIAGNPRNPPLSLGGATVKVRDSAGVERPAPMLYVSSSQVNYVVPPGTASGSARVTITSAEGVASSAGLDIEPVAPGLFSGALVVRDLGTTVTSESVVLPISVAGGRSGEIGSGVIDLSGADETYLILFGTGLRLRTSLANISATFDGIDVPVQYAGRQPEFAGVDQLNLKLPKSLAGRSGPLNLTVDGNAALNVVYLTFK